jgi:hypothetical protein
VSLLPEHSAAAVQILGRSLVRRLACLYQQLANTSVSYSIVREPALSTSFILTKVCKLRCQ